MNIYEAESVVNFFGGMLSCIEILSSYNVLDEDNILKSEVYKNYHIDGLLKAVELVEANDLVKSHGGLEAARQHAHKDCFTYNKELLAACYLVGQCS